MNIYLRDLNGSSVDFQTDDEQLTAIAEPVAVTAAAAGAATKKEKKKAKGKKRKATDSCDEESDEGIIYSPWGANNLVC